ncbi:MAG: alginate lyase family protein [Phycisphaerae bacterium]
MRDATDRFLISRQGQPRPWHRIVSVPPDGPVTAPDVLGVHLRRDDCRFTKEEADRWQAALTTQADRIVDHRLDLFDLADHHLGEKIDWNYEYKVRKHTSMRAASAVDYRDYAANGDCKFVWEPNRHHQLVVLGRAYHVTHDEGYAAAAVEQLDNWIRQCPYGRGMNWRSPLELAIRLINWVWTLELINGSSVMTPDRRERFLQLVYQHLFEITRKYSRFSSANNHLIGEAAGVFIAGSYFTGLKTATRWCKRSREILAREILRQTYSDGGTREQATGYHLFALQFFLLAGLVARNGGDDFAQPYWDRLERMFDFVAFLSEGGESLPMIGDCDDGYVLDLGGRANVVASLMCIGAILFERPDFKARAGEFQEAAFWLFGPEGRDRFERIESEPVEVPIGPRALPDAGCYLLQRGRRRIADRISVLFDCGELGFLSIAAHGHADALSIVLRVAGVDVLVDPGTYDYFTYGPWREYFRSTRAHNTVVIDDMDQSQMLGLFLWGRKARCRCIRWAPTLRGGVVSAEHNGYARLADPVVHRRTVTLQDDEAELIVQDDILARGEHSVAMYWHLAEHCRVEAKGHNHFEIDYGDGFVTVTMDSRLSVSMVTGSEKPILGWVSRTYHRKVHSTTLVGRCASEGSLSLTTRFAIMGKKGVSPIILHTFPFADANIRNNVDLFLSRLAYRPPMDLSMRYI